LKNIKSLTLSGQSSTKINAKIHSDENISEIWSGTS